MELTSFAFGVLSMIGLLLAILVVVGAVKAIKQRKQLTELIMRLSQFEQDTTVRISNSIDHMQRRINETEGDLNIRINNQHTELTASCNSYTDKRIDKLVDTYFSLKGAKQLINENK